jgi:hypothetical protein
LECWKAAACDAGPAARCATVHGGVFIRSHAFLTPPPHSRALWPRRRSMTLGGVPYVLLVFANMAPSWSGARHHSEPTGKRAHRSPLWPQHVHDLRRDDRKAGEDAIEQRERRVDEAVVGNDGGLEVLHGGAGSGTLWRAEARECGPQRVHTSPAPHLCRVERAEEAEEACSDGGTKAASPNGGRAVVRQRASQARPPRHSPADMRITLKRYVLSRAMVGESKMEAATGGCGGEPASSLGRCSLQRATHGPNRSSSHGRRMCFRGTLLRATVSFRAVLVRSELHLVTAASEGLVGRALPC